MRKHWFPATCFAAGVALAAAGGRWLPATQAADPPPKFVPAGGELKAANACVEQTVALGQIGAFQPEALYQWSLRAARAEAEVGDRRKPYVAHRERMENLERLMRLRIDAGRATPLDGYACEFYVAEAKRLAHE